MTNSVQVMGINEAQTALRQVDTTISAFTKKVVLEVTSKINDVARAGTPVDTGALKASVHYKIVKAEPHYIEAHVQAGDEDIIRGLGAFTESKYEDKIRPTPTTVYVRTVEKKHGFMQRAYDWGLVEVPKQIKNILRKAVKI